MAQHEVLAGTDSLHIEAANHNAKSASTLRPRISIPQSSKNRLLLHVGIVALLCVRKLPVPSS